jgi:hypothetical protein
MGLAASQARLMMLVARKSDLEYQLQLINNQRMQLANMVGGLSNEMAKNFDQGANDNVNKGLQARILSIQQIDKVFEMQAQRINTQHEAVQTEIGAVQKVIQKNIQMSFKLMG